MDAHEQVRLYCSYKELWNSVPSNRMYEILVHSGFNTVEEFHKYNFAACIQVISFLEIDTREKTFPELTEEIKILMGLEVLSHEVV